MTNKIYSMKSVYFQQDKGQPETVLILADDDVYSYTQRIGRFNFYTKEGWLTTSDGKRKDYKQWKALFNNFFKMDEYFGWDSTEIDKAMKYANNKVKEEKIKHEAKLNQEQERKADLFIKTINEGNFNLYEKVKGKNDEELTDLINLTFRNRLSKRMVLEVLTALKEFRDRWMG